MTAARPRLHQRLGFKLGLLLALAFLCFELVTFPFGEDVYRLIFPEWWNPDALRAEADRLENEARDEALRGETSTQFKLFTYALMALSYAVFFAVLFGFLVSRLAMRRLTALSETARAPIENGELPGPFRDRGHDEVAVLAHTLNSMRDRIEELVATLEGRDRQRREWIAQVSHDLRTPLTALQVCLDRLDERLGEEDAIPVEVGELLRTASADVQRVSSLADDLLEVARLELDDALHREPVLPGEIVQQAVRVLSPLAEAKHIAMATSSEKELPTLNADGRRLLRALENLLINSIQHAESEVTVSAHGDGKAVHFVVEDDGPGLPNGSAPERSRADSAGIGLQVTERVAVAHDGRLEARNRTTGGARFALVIPSEPAS